MSTDLPQQAPPSGRSVPPRGATPPRSGASAVAIVVALVAALLGFFILKKIDNNTTNITTSGGPVVTTPVSGSGGSTATAPGSAVTVAQTTPAVASIARTPIVVVVANSSGIKGAAATVSTKLKTLGYTTLPPGNASGNKKISASLVFVAAGQEAAATQVMADLGLVNVIPAPIPTDATKIPLLASSRQGATVVVILGTDLASATGGTPPSPPATISPGASVTTKATATKATTPTT